MSCLPYTTIIQPLVRKSSGNFKSLSRKDLQLAGLGVLAVNPLRFALYEYPVRESNPCPLCVKEKYSPLYELGVFIVYIILELSI